MTPKPAGCEGCPFQRASSAFVPDELVESAPVLVMGQGPGRQEEAAGRPFVGPTGQLWERKFLPASGFQRAEVSVCNAIRCRPYGKDELPGLRTRVMQDALAHCTRAHFRVPAGVQLMVAQGAYATAALTDQLTVDDDDERDAVPRGYLIPRAGERDGDGHPWVPSPDRVPVLPTLHIAALFDRGKERVKGPNAYWAPVAWADWDKVRRILARAWPAAPPKFRYEPVSLWPARVAFDTEYTPTGKLIRYSLSWGPGDGETAVVEDSPHTLIPYGSRITMQYSPADIPYLEKLTGSRNVWQDYELHDTVIKHATLHGDLPHNLNFLGSIYGSINQWKHLAGTSPELYAGCDAFVTREIDDALDRELGRDSGSQRAYALDRRALPYFVHAQRKGLAVNGSRVLEVRDSLGRRTSASQYQMTAICGWPLNPGSPKQVGKRLFQVEGLR